MKFGLLVILLSMGLLLLGCAQTAAPPASAAAPPNSAPAAPFASAPANPAPATSGSQTQSMKSLGAAGLNNKRCVSPIVTTKVGDTTTYNLNYTIDFKDYTHFYDVEQLQTSTSSKQTTESSMTWGVGEKTYTYKNGTASGFIMASHHTGDSGNFMIDKMISGSQGSQILCSDFAPPDAELAPPASIQFQDVSSMAVVGGSK